MLRIAAPIGKRGRPPGATVGASGPGTPDATLVVEVGQARVAVHPGFDRATLAALLDVLTGSAGER